MDNALQIKGPTPRTLTIADSQAEEGPDTTHRAHSPLSGHSTTGTVTVPESMKLLPGLCGDKHEGVCQRMDMSRSSLYNLTHLSKLTEPVPLT